MRLGGPLNLSDAPSHPAFAYRPETGEDPFHALLGVPLLRGGRAIGVLLVQNRASRTYGEDEVEDLQIIAMVLAEMVATGDLLAPRANSGTSRSRPTRPERLKGARFADGLALGVAVLHEPPWPVDRLLADDVAAEERGWRRRSRPCGRRSTACSTATRGFSGHRTTCSRPTSCSPTAAAGRIRLQEAVRSGLTAEAAVERVRSEHRASLGQARDAYLRERVHDLEDLNDRLLRHLSGDGVARRPLPDNAILIARNLGPADLLEYGRGLVRGLLLEEGSAASHAVIVAKAMDIPVRRTPRRTCATG